jgi:hypothetical protein
MNPKIFCYGDSNAASQQMPKGQHPFVHWVAKELSCGYSNYARPGESMGKILHTLISSHTQITSNDIVLVSIPPDTRWYDENEKDGFYTLASYARDDYFKFLNEKSLEWFRYHHALFIYSMQKIFNDIGCYYIMTHSYGDLTEIKKYHLSIDFARFLNELDLLNLLNFHNNDKISYWNPYDDTIPKANRYDKDCPGLGYTNDETNPYMMKDGHPSELGHQLIAKLMIEKMKNDGKK